ncbi:glycoside hydrolase superfamily [Lipomyces japonicus]|uniref:glycoside hydrolase superfamily n=1 Tax=Lipomyces japonicus TaxID=56871 RepID=UPI0034CF09E4
MSKRKRINIRDYASKFWFDEPVEFELPPDREEAKLVAAAIDAHFAEHEQQQLETQQLIEDQVRNAMSDEDPQQLLKELSNAHENDRGNQVEDDAGKRRAVVETGTNSQPAAHTVANEHLRFLIVTDSVVNMVLKHISEKIHFHIGSRPFLAKSPPLPSNPPSDAEIIKYRRQFGTNIGGWFLLEKWIKPEMHIFNESDDESEYSAVSSAVSSIGIIKTRDKWNQHYDSFVTEEDWKWLAYHHVNSVRIPIGFYVLGSEFVSGTPYGLNNLYEVYQDAWNKYLKVIKTADEYGIGVLIDLHGLPGGANDDAHSGIPHPGKFFESSSSISLAVSAVKFITEQVKNYKNVIGIQIVNEAKWNAHAEKYYAEAITEIREIDPTQIVVISDAWDRGKFETWVKDKPGVLVDTHIYKCFSESDREKNPHDLVCDISQEIFGPATIVGEYSCVLSTTSWAKIGESRKTLRREFGHAQIDRFLFQAVGSYFWTYKFAEGSGGEWDFREMVNTECIPIVNRTRKHASQDIEALANQVTGYHAAYWTKNGRGAVFEHWRYREGYVTGFKDAKVFWEKDESTIGQLQYWKNARLQQHIQQRGSSDNTWEFEHGYEGALQDFKNTVN